METEIQVQFLVTSKLHSNKGARVTPSNSKAVGAPPLLAEARWIPTNDESFQRTPGVSPGCECPVICW